MSARTRQIMLLRHAKAEPESLAGDFTRRLTEAGREHTTRLGARLHDLRLFPQSIYSSSAQRALDTAIIICEQLDIDDKQIGVRDDLYLAGIDTYLSLLKQLDPRYTRVMLVGHNPALEDLLQFLCNKPVKSDLDNGKLMLPATLMTLSFEGDWSALAAYSCELDGRLHGKLLTET